MGMRIASKRQRAESLRASRRASPPRRGRDEAVRKSRAEIRPTKRRARLTAPRGSRRWKPVYRSLSSSACQTVAQASEGMRRSPRGLTAAEPTLGPSGRQLRLNCWAKKRR